MRTTLALDDDIFAYARERAKRERISIGQAISKLARDGDQLRAASMGQPTPVTSKYALMPQRGEIITTEHVHDLLNQKSV